MSPIAVMLLIIGATAVTYYAFRDIGTNFIRSSPILSPAGRNVEQKARERRQNSKTLAPLSGTCGACKAKALMPFRCSYCGGVFCSDHRLPEDHGCDGM